MNKNKSRRLFLGSGLSAVVAAPLAWFSGSVDARQLPVLPGVSVMLATPGDADRSDPLGMSGYIGWKVPCHQCRHLFGQWQHVNLEAIYDGFQMPTEEQVVEAASKVLRQEGFTQASGWAVCPGCRGLPQSQTKLIEGETPVPVSWFVA